MPWDPNETEIPINKPKEITELELMGRETLSSMPPREMDEKIEEAANAIAQQFNKQEEGDYESCVAVVSVALSITGSALGGEFGNLMVGKSDSQAQHACRRIYRTEPDEEKL